MWLTLLFAGLCVLFVRLRTAESRLERIEKLLRETVPEQERRKILDQAFPPRTGSVWQAPLVRPVASTTPAPDAPPARPPAQAGPATPLPGIIPEHTPEQVEKTLGTQLAVWAGGLMLALGGVFLLTVSIADSGIGAFPRILSGVAFGLALIGIAESLRRRELASPAAAGPNIPSILAGIGSLAIFAAIYAAYALYGLIPAPVAFLLLGLSGIGTMVALTVHGPALAGVGLVGALATPILVLPDAPNPWSIALYAPLVVATAHAFAWHKGWKLLAIAASVGGMLWTVILLAGPYASLALSVHALLQMAQAAWTFGVVPYRASTPPDGRLAADGFLVVSVPLVALSLYDVGLGGGLGPTWMGVAFATVLIPLFLALTREAFRLHVATAGVSALVFIAAWPTEKWGTPQRFRMRREAWPMEMPSAYLAFSALLAACVVLASLWIAFRKRPLPAFEAPFLAAAASVTAPAALALASYRFLLGETSWGFAVAAFALAAALCVPVRHLNRRVQAAPRADSVLVLSGLVCAVLASISLGWGIALTGDALNLTLALTAAAAARISVMMGVPPLRYAVGALAVLVTVRIGSDPLLLRSGVSATPILNWIAVAYGVPAVAFAYAGWTLRGREGKDDAPVILTQSLALLLGTCLLALETRHLVHGSLRTSGLPTLFEAGLYTTWGLGIASGLARLRAHRDSLAIRAWGRLATSVSVVLSLGVLCIGVNPILTGVPILGPFPIGDILASYGLNAALALTLVPVVAHLRRGMVPLIRWTAILLAFLTVTLCVRSSFQGSHLGWRFPMGQAELYAYSVCWLVLALAFLAYGAARASWPARWAGFVLLGITVGKVFLYDMAGLSGFYRAASFIVLGAVLMGIGFLYQRSAIARRDVRAGA